VDPSGPDEVEPVLEGSSKFRLSLSVEVAIIGLLLFLATYLRSVNISGGFPHDYDEGVYSISAYMVLEGYRLFSDVFSSQPPLVVSTVAAFLLFFGRSVASLRLLSILSSIIAILASYLLSRRLAGPFGELLSAILLVASPQFLLASRTAMGEVPSIGLGMLSLYLFVGHLGSDRSSEAVLAGFTASLSCLMKLTGAYLVLPMLVALFLRRRSRIFLFLIGFLVPMLVVPYFGIGKVFDQAFLFHLRKPATATPLDRVGTAVSFLAADAGLLALSLVGGALCLGWGRFEESFLGLVAPFLLVMLVSYRSLFQHHLVVLISLLCVLAGIGFSHIVRFLSKGLPRTRRATRAGGRTTLVALMLSLLMGFYLWNAPRLLSKKARIVAKTSPREIDKQALSLVRSLSSSEDFIVTDEQSFAFSAHRRVPPALCDTSNMRILSGYLDSEAVIGCLREYDVKVVIFWTGRLTKLKELVSYVRGNFRLVKDFGGGKKVYARGRDQEERDTSSWGTQPTCALRCWLNVHEGAHMGGL